LGTYLSDLFAVVLCVSCQRIEDVNEETQMGRQDCH